MPTMVPPTLEAVRIRINMLGWDATMCAGRLALDVLRRCS